LLTQSQRDRIEVVLVSPRNPLNIGAVARAMANFGFSRLTVVAAYDPHWREARSAVDAPELLQNSKSAATLAEAVAECTFVAGTGTLAHRKAEQPVLALPDVPSILVPQLDRGGRIALVFGPEKHGLTRDDLSFCHVLIEILTDPRQPSMNLGQAVAVSLYELARAAPWGDTSLRGVPPFPQRKMERVGQGVPGVERAGSFGKERAGRGDSEADVETSPVEPPALSSSLDRLAGLIEETMIGAGYSPRAMQPANRHDLRLLLRRLAPSARDTRRMMGLFRRILHRLNKSSTSPHSFL
jgi:tRNA/rRNA methyltransferase